MKCSLNKRCIIMLVMFFALCGSTIYFIYEAFFDVPPIEWNIIDFQSSKDKIDEEIVYYTDEALNGADPELENNMIAIKYVDGAWVKADVTKEWYNYTNFNWANVVIPKEDKLEDFKEMEIGSIINDDDIYGYFVWIPRFEYKLFNVNNDKVKEQMIEVNFVNKDTDKLTNIVNGEYFTHPAFTAEYSDGSSYELNGFWIAKFEPSLNEVVEIKPGKSTLVNLNMAEMWEYATGVKNIYGFDSDSRIITNMEWGAIAYLSYSQYGKENNSAYTGNSKRIFLNTAMGNENTWDRVMTGCSSGRVDGAGTYNCPYTYDEEYYGVGASSTGTVYGLYDLVGGSWECAMSVVSNVFPLPDNFGGYDGTPPSEKRYYSIYKVGVINDFSRGMIGDATRETLSSTLTDKSWNGNLAYFATKSFPWMKRGGTFRGGSNSGLFDYGITNAIKRGDKTFRIIVSKY